MYLFFKTLNLHSLKFQQEMVKSNIYHGILRSDSIGSSVVKLAALTPLTCYIDELLT